ncbi:MAG: heavy-metal-associated domain-containing protein [Candidatus Methylomirabilales bacterium]
MSLEISLRVKGLDRAEEGSSNALEKLVKTLQGLYGILAVHSDLESHQLTVRYDPSWVTILRILSRIESAGRQRGLAYRATDVRKIHKSSTAPHSQHSSSDRLPAAETAHFSAR